MTDFEKALQELRRVKMATKPKPESSMAEDIQALFGGEIMNKADFEEKYGKRGR
jgi:hypothetical protein